MINIKMRVMIKTTKRGVPYFTHKGETWVSATYGKSSRYSNHNFISLLTGQIRTFFIV